MYHYKGINHQRQWVCEAICIQDRLTANNSSLSMNARPFILSLSRSLFLWIAFCCQFIIHLFEWERKLHKRWEMIAEREGERERPALFLASLNGFFLYTILLQDTTLFFNFTLSLVLIISHLGNKLAMIGTQIDKLDILMIILPPLHHHHCRHCRLLSNSPLFALSLTLPFVLLYYATEGTQVSAQIDVQAYLKQWKLRNERERKREREGDKR